MTLAEEEGGSAPGLNADYETQFRVTWWKWYAYLHPDAREMAINAEWARYCRGEPATPERGA